MGGVEGVEQKQNKKFPQEVINKKKYFPMDSGQKNMSKEKKNISTLHVQKYLASLKIPTPSPPAPSLF